MQTTACTDNYYSTTVVGYVPASGSTVGSVTTFKTAKPEWTDGDGNRTIQCNAIAIGGFEGLNS